MRKLKIPYKQVLKMLLNFCQYRRDRNVPSIVVGVSQTADRRDIPVPLLRFQVLLPHLSRKSQKSKILILCFVSFMLLFPVFEHAWGAFAIVQNNRPSCSVVVSEKLTPQEEFAVEDLNYFVERFTGATLADKPDSEPLPDGNVILIGAPDNNRYIGELQDRGLVSRIKDSAEEEFIVKVVHDGNRDFLIIMGGKSGGVIYGVYALVEEMIASITGLIPADPDFYVERVSSLSVGMLNIRSAPFYPVRCALSQEDPTWMTRHRLNVSGAEGVWSGTGIDDGLGTAFKYIHDWQFDDMQDEAFSRRSERITTLRERIRKLDARGIDSYLFMYVMGEPTKAMMKNHPELLEDAVDYGASRNGRWYQPISWTKPEAREMIKELVKSIVRTYSPWLTGFHLRAWGGEARAPAGNDEEQQELLWEIYSDIMDAAREINPNFKLLISGYDQYWLRDPDRIHIANLPRETILMHKWGIDGEPTSDPGIPAEFINTIGIHGLRILILSHDTEEAMPLWMVEGDLFVEGVRKYADNIELNGLGGFTLQGEGGLTHLDKLVSARIGWNPYEDHVALMSNYLTSYYGLSAAERILAALRINSLTLSDYFSDYAGSLSVTGQYGKGSRGYATRFWDVIGQKAVEDTLSIPDAETVAYTAERFASLIPRQQEAANEIAAGRNSARFVSAESERDYFDGLHLMKMWVRLFESRLRLVESLEVGFKGGSREQVMQKLSSAIEYSREMQMEIAEIKRFTRIFHYDDFSARQSLVTTVEEEIEFLKNFDPSELIRTPEQEEKIEEVELSITELISHPNPMSNRATFCYELTASADEVTINIYTVLGKRVRTITGASARAGYNEEMWEAKDDDGKKLASGTYLYKITAKRDDREVQKISKLSIVR